MEKHIYFDITMKWVILLEKWKKLFNVHNDFHRFKKNIKSLNVYFLSHFQENRKVALNSISKVPFETFHSKQYIDHFLSIDKYVSSKKCIFLIVDAFSKYVKLYSTKIINSLKSCLKEFFRNYNKLLMLYQIKAFTSKEFKNFI